MHADCIQIQKVNFITLIDFITNLQCYISQNSIIKVLQDFTVFLCLMNEFQTVVVLLACAGAFVLPVQAQGGFELADGLPLPSSRSRLKVK